MFQGTYRFGDAVVLMKDTFTKMSDMELGHSTEIQPKAAGPWTKLLEEKCMRQ